MKHFLTALAVMGLLSIGACAQSNPAPATGLAKGTYLRADFSRTVDAKKAKVGDEVIARITDDVRAEGKVAVREGATLTGHLTEVQASTKEHPESKLAIVFDKIVLKNGQEIPVDGEIQLLMAHRGLDAPYSVDTRGDKANISAMDRAAGPVQAPPGVQPGQVADQHAINEPLWAQNSPRRRQPVGRETAIEGLFLSAAVSGATQVSIVSSPKRNVKLEQGYVIEVRVGGDPAASRDVKK
jgi:hypothetical protein